MTLLICVDESDMVETPKGGRAAGDVFFSAVVTMYGREERGLRRMGRSGSNLEKPRDFPIGILLHVVIVHNAKASSSQRENLRTDGNLLSEMAITYVLETYYPTFYENVTVY